jgi:hypothetical protein
MNFDSNLPEPTYKLNKISMGFENTKEFLKSIVFLTKKVLRL